MKLRIKGNSVRYRLSRPEVEALPQTGYLEERTDFGPAALVYALRVRPEGSELSAAFKDNKITLYVPEALIRGWAESQVVGFEGHTALEGAGSLHLLLEKDFKCLDRPTEDQSDNYDKLSDNCKPG
jgi:hypothetical protein